MSHVTQDGEDDESCNETRQAIYYARKNGISVFVVCQAMQNREEKRAVSGMWEDSH